MKTILITVANGMFGSRLAAMLADKPGISLRLMLRNPSKCLLTGSNIRICQADMDMPESMESHFKGVDAVFMSTPMDFRLGVREKCIINLSQKNGVSHMVKMHGAVKHQNDHLGDMHSESLAFLQNSGLQWTLISPNSVMETSLFAYQPVIKYARAINGCSGERKIGLVALADVTRAAALVIENGGHHEQNYQLTGPRALNMTEIAACFTKVLGKEIVYIDMSEQKFKNMLMKYDKTLTDEKLELEILCHLREWKNGGADLVTDTFFRLTGQQPTPLEDFIAANRNFFSKGMLPAFMARFSRKSMIS